MYIIDIFLFIILISSIFLYSPVGKIIIEHVLNKKRKDMDYIELYNRHNELSSKINEHEDEINKLREMILFYETRLDSKNIPVIDTKKNIKRQIDLDKNL